MEDNNDRICTSVEIMDGYASNLKESDFSKGDIVLSRIDSIENVYNATVKDIISDWEYFTGDNYENISKHFDTMSSDSILLYHVDILRSFFTRRVNSDNWTRGNYIIVRKGVTFGREDLKLNSSAIPKGVIIFSSLEEAEFVDFMMSRYFDPHDEWRDLYEFIYCEWFK